MADETKRNDEPSCDARCEQDFIECVESWSQDCMDRYGSCSSACGR